MPPVSLLSCAKDLFRRANFGFAAACRVGSAQRLKRRPLLAATAIICSVAASFEQGEIVPNLFRHAPPRDVPRLRSAPLSHALDLRQEAIRGFRDGPSVTTRASVADADTDPGSGRDPSQLCRLAKTRDVGPGHGSIARPSKRAPMTGFIVQKPRPQRKDPQTPPGNRLI